MEVEELLPANAIICAIKKDLTLFFGDTKIAKLPEYEGNLANFAVSKSGFTPRLYPFYD